MNNETDQQLNATLGQGAEDDLTPLDIKPLPGFLRFMPELIKSIHAMGAQFQMSVDGVLLVDGFYRNGPMRLDLDDHGHLVAIDRRDRKTAIATVDDLIQLNFQWWRMSISKTTYMPPERPWLDKFIEKRWVRRKVIFEPLEGAEGDATVE